MSTQRHVSGAIGLLLLLIGLAGYARGNADVVTAGLVRAGSLLAVTWLAWPTLLTLKQRAPQLVTIAACSLAAILVARPSLGKIAAVVVFLLIAASLLFRWLSQLSKPPSNP